MKLYPVEKSIRILNRWAKGTHSFWQLRSREILDRPRVILFIGMQGEVFYDDVDFTAKTERQALHKAAKWVEGNK